MEKTDKTGYLGHLTIPEQKVLSEFKAQIHKLALEAWKYDLASYDDYDYLRFLRARKFDLKKTLDMFQKYIQWRTEFGVDQIYRYKYPEYDAVKQVYMHGSHKTDKWGRPLHIERIGTTNIDKLFTLTTKERIVKYYVREYEKQKDYEYPACSIAAGRKVETGICIVDLKGGSSVLLTPRCYGFVKIASNLCQNYYPEMLEMYYMDK